MSFDNKNSHDNVSGEIAVVVKWHVIWIHWCTEDQQGPETHNDGAILMLNALDLSLISPFDLLLAVSVTVYIYFTCIITLCSFD